MKSDIKTFEELECYNESRKLRQMVSSFASALPVEERYLLRSQILDSSRSITANIAEGYGRHHHQENLQFCRQARGSLTETLDHLNCGLDDGYLPAASYQQIRSQLETAWQILNGYIRYLDHAAKAQRVGKVGNQSRVDKTVMPQ